MQSQVTDRLKQAFASAADQHRRGQLNEARRLYQLVLDMDPRNADALHLLGVIALQSGNPREAIALITRAIAENGQVRSFHNNLGNALRASGALEPAAQAFQHALALHADSPDTRYNLGVVLQELGRFDEAVGAYQEVIRARPDHAAAHGNLGNIFVTRGQHEEALACYERALASQSQFLPALVNRGNVLKSLGRIEEAVENYRRAVSINSRCAEAHNNLGLILLDEGQVEQAIAAYQRALAAQPDFEEAHRNLGHALKEHGEGAMAVASYHKALSLDPHDAEARLGLALVSIPVFLESSAASAGVIADFEQAVAALAEWNRECPGRLGEAVGKTQPFYLAYRPYNLVGALSRYGDLVGGAAAAHWTPDDPLRPRASVSSARIRVAVVCGHVRGQHPVWDMLLRGIIAHLRRERLEIFLYHTGSSVDAETEWARLQVERFVQGPKPMADWIEDLRAAQPDVIFYPEIGMDPVTCTLAALRLAPLQVASWGHPVTTGLPTVDLYVSGELLESAQGDQHYREKLIRLPGTGSCARAPSDAARPFDLGEAAGNPVRFALPHQPMKFDPADDMLLARIAQLVGRCEFWIASPAKLGWATQKLIARLGAVFRAEGLDPDAHLRLTPWLRPEEFLGFLDAMDVYLDCAAFSGYTTAWQAVHRGLPIVTLEGEFLRQRLAAGLLRQMQVPDGIAASQDEYVTRAVHLAEESRDPQRRADRRQLIRAASRKADENLAAIAAFERVLTEAADTRAAQLAGPPAVR